jgi:Resolvase, N terminal domain
VSASTSSGVLAVGPPDLLVPGQNAGSIGSEGMTSTPSSVVIPFEVPITGPGCSPLPHSRALSRCLCCRKYPVSGGRQSGRSKPCMLTVSNRSPSLGSLSPSRPATRGRTSPPAAPRRHPGRLETGPPGPLPAALGCHRHRPGQARDRLPQPPGGDRHHHPGGKLVFHLFAALAESEPDPIRERTSGGLAAARARGRHRGRPRL